MIRSIILLEHRQFYHTFFTLIRESKYHKKCKTSVKRINTPTTQTFDKATENSIRPLGDLKNAASLSLSLSSYSPKKAAHRGTILRAVYRATIFPAVKASRKEATLHFALRYIETSLHSRALGDDNNDTCKHGAGALMCAQQVLKLVARIHIRAHARTRDFRSRSWG